MWKSTTKVLYYGYHRHLYYFRNTNWKAGEWIWTVNGCSKDLLKGCSHSFPPPTWQVLHILLSSSTPAVETQIVEILFFISFLKSFWPSPGQSHFRNPSWEEMMDVCILRAVLPRYRFGEGISSAFLPSQQTPVLEMHIWWLEPTIKMIIIEYSK